MWLHNIIVRESKKFLLLDILTLIKKFVKKLYYKVKRQATSKNSSALSYSLAINSNQNKAIIKSFIISFILLFFCKKSNKYPIIFIKIQALKYFRNEKSWYQ